METNILYDTDWFIIRQEDNYYTVYNPLILNSAVFFKLSDCIDYIHTFY